MKIHSACLLYALSACQSNSIKLPVPHTCQLRRQCCCLLRCKHFFSSSRLYSFQISVLSLVSSALLHFGRRLGNDEMPFFISSVIMHTKRHTRSEIIISWREECKERFLLCGEQTTIETSFSWCRDECAEADFGRVNWNLWVEFSCVEIVQISKRARNGSSSTDRVSIMEVEELKSFTWRNLQISRVETNVEDWGKMFKWNKIINSQKKKTPRCEWVEGAENQ